MRLRSALSSHVVTYATVDPANKDDVPGCDFVVVPDGNINTKIALVGMAARVFRLVSRLRPDVVITTGAAPGYFTVRFGRCFGARTIWVDSIANAHRLSISGAAARKYADVWLTQWPDLETSTGPFYEGNIL